MKEKAVVTALGNDQTGIVYRISKILYENNVNILDITQKVFSENTFSMVMIVELPDENSIEILSEKLNSLSEIGVKTFIQGTKLFNSVHKL